uniref:Interleukin-6 n=1 Tax=Monopterus albus TaxID=43700 RepID=A0A3Q3K8T1_MONAL
LYTDAYLLSAVLLAALLPSAPGAPVENITTESVEDGPSGEEVEAPQMLSADPVWYSMLGPTEGHQKEFEAEFQSGIKFTSLEQYKIPSIPEKTFPFDACLHRLVEGLNNYTVLLRHVEREYPNNLILLAAKSHSRHLISLIKGKMRHSERVTALTSSQQEQLLRDIENDTTFHSRITAHSILRQFRNFLVDGKRAICQREMKKCGHRCAAESAVTAFTVFCSC